MIHPDNKQKFAVYSRLICIMQIFEEASWWVIWFALFTDHSRPQRPRSFWSAPRIATSGQVQRHSCFEFAFVTRRHIDIRTRSSKQPTNPPKCCTVTMVNRDYCSVKNCRFNSFSNKRTDRVSFHKIPTQSHLKTVWKRFIRRGKPRNHTVGEIHSVNLVFIRGYPFSLCSLCSCFPGFVGVW